VITDRRGDSLASGGDNDICLTALEQGWQVGYFPQLQLTHLIPAGRMTLDYQRRMARDAMKSFILMLDQHGIRPWPAIPSWSVPLRLAKDYFRVQPWRGPERLLKWCMNRGRYEGCAALSREGERLLGDRREGKRGITGNRREE
jgi:GT2 family glycosyltransferase